MIDDNFPLQPHARAWLRQSALEAHATEYWAYLGSRRYAASTRRVYLVCVAHFAHSPSSFFCCWADCPFAG